MEETSKKLGQFLDFFWRETDSLVYIPTFDKGREFKKYMFEWPRQRKAAINHILSNNAKGIDVYFSPALYKKPGPGEKPSPVKDNVLGTHVLWADFDGNAPNEWGEVAEKHSIPEPTLSIQSSVEGHEHVYWELSEFLTDTEIIDERNRSIAYTLEADTTGWDADQVLRPGFTHNFGHSGERKFKDWYEGEPVEVTLKFKNDTKSNVNAFSELVRAEKAALEQIEIGEIPHLSKVLAFGNWSPDLYELLSQSLKDIKGPDGSGDRSGALMRLGYMGAEQGFTDEEIYSIIQDADDRWQKYTKLRPETRKKRILDIIARARAKHGYLTAEDLTLAGLTKDLKVEESADAQLVYGFQEFMDTDVHIDWLIDQLLSQGGIGMVTGHPGVGKTQLGIQLAMTLAKGGKEFIGWNNVGGPKKVLFLSLEMSHAPLKLFFDTIQNNYPNDRATLARNMHIAPMGSSIPLDRIEGQAFLDNMMSEYRPDVLFIDSLQKITSKELTDELAAKALLEYLDRIRLKYNTAIYMIHHNRKKSNERQARGADDLSDMYGSQYLSANVDFVISLRKSKAKDIIGVDMLKNRLGPEREFFALRRNENLQYSEVGEIDMEAFETNNPVKYIAPVQGASGEVEVL